MMFYEQLFENNHGKKLNMFWKIHLGTIQYNTNVKFSQSKGF